MPLIPFPSVPKLPGVPALPRSAKFPPIVRAGLGLLQGMLWRIFQVQTRWGIWDSKGKPLGDPSKFTGLIGNALEAAGLGSGCGAGKGSYGDCGCGSNAECGFLQHGTLSFSCLSLYGSCFRVMLKPLLPQRY